MTAEEFSEKHASHYQNFMKRVRAFDDTDPDSKNPDGSVRDKSDVVFFRLNPDKHLTSMQLGTWLEKTVTCEIIGRCYYSYERWQLRADVCPFTKKMMKEQSKERKDTIGLTMCHFRTVFGHTVCYAGIVDLDAPVNEEADGTLKGPPEDWVFPSITPGLVPFKIDVSCKNEKKKQVAKGKKQQKGGGFSNAMVGIFLVERKICVNCGERPTSLTVAGFKKCSRCWVNLGVCVWYCSKECQVEKFQFHKAPCQALQVNAIRTNELVVKTREGSTEYACIHCGIAPVRRTVHLFRECIRCRATGVSTWYCSEPCHLASMATHVPICEARARRAGTPSADYVIAPLQGLNTLLVE